MSLFIFMCIFILGKCDCFEIWKERILVWSVERVLNVEYRNVNRLLRSVHTRRLVPATDSSPLKSVHKGSGLRDVPHKQSTQCV